MSADTTPRNGSRRVHRDLADTLPRVGETFETDEDGCSGRTLNSSPAQSSLTLRDRTQDKVDAVTEWLKDFFVPPAWLVSTPATWDELAAYAHHNVRMQNAPAIVQALGSAWLYLVVFPAVAKARFREWVLQRPARALLFIGVADLFIRTTPAGHWIAWLIRGWFHVLAVVFLP